MRNFTLLFLFAALSVQALQAQNTKNQEVEYRYIKLPLMPLPASIKNYQSFVIPAFAAENQRKQAAYDAEVAAAEAEYQKAMDAYPGQVKAAEDKFNAEMEEWKKKSLLDKVVEKEILKENNKPVKQIPSAPYRRSVTPPNLQTTYDYPAVASTYLILQGFENNAADAVKIEVTLNGYDYTKPQQITQMKKVVSVANGQSTTREVPSYHIEFSYRHAMSVKVTDATGKEILFATPQELNSYKIYKSAESTTAYPLNEQQLAKTYEEKIFQENLLFINNLVNDKIGFKRELRKTELGFVKAKDDVYSDLLIAFNDASAGLKILVDDEAGAKAKLQSAINIWNTALQESDINNKKARIDKDVTIMIYFNLLESYFAMRDVAGADKVISALNAIPISNNERKQKEAYESLFNDLKKRLQANKI